MFGLIPAIIGLGLLLVVIPFCFLGLPAIAHWQLKRRQERGWW